MKKAIFKENNEVWEITGVDTDFSVGDKIRGEAPPSPPWVDVIKKIVYEKDKTFLYTVKGLKISI